jgi:hypothetical protein
MVIYLKSKKGNEIRPIENPTKEEMLEWNRDNRVVSRADYEAYLKSQGESDDALLPGKIEAEEAQFNGEPEPSPAAPSALEGVRNALGYGLPLMEAGHKAAYQNAVNKGLPPLAAEAAGVAGGVAGGAADVMQYATSPSAKIAGLPMIAAAKAAPKMAAKAAAIADKSPGLLGTYGKNIAANTSDAAITSNIAGNVSGENKGLHLGTGDIAAGAAGGMLKSRGELIFKNQAVKSQNYAARNNADMNFAERYTGKKGKAAVEQVISEEITKGKKLGGLSEGTFEGTVKRLRETGDKLDAEFYKHLDEVGDHKININPMEILEDIREYGIRNTKNLGMEFTKKVSDEIENEFLQHLRTIKQIRLVKASETNPALHVSEYDAMNLANDMSLGQLANDLGDLTLREMDYMKRGMQSATSQYNRGAGTMERQGLQSRANKESSEGILNHFQKQIESDGSITSSDKLKIIEQLSELSDGIGQKIGGNLDEIYLNTLKSKGIISGADLKKYMDLNKSRSETIGKRKIMERAHEKYMFLEGKEISGIKDLNNLNESMRQPLGVSARNPTQKAFPSSEILSTKEKEESKQDNTAVKKYDKGLPSLKDK